MNETSIIEKLAQTPLFASLPQTELQKLASIASVRTVAKSNILFTEGESAEGFFIILSGQIRVYKVAASGKEQTLHVFGPKQPVGEAAVFAKEPYPANAESLQDSELLFFSRKDFLHLLQEFPDVALSMMSVMARRLMQFTRLVEDLALKEAPTRLAAYLLLLSERQKGADTIDIEFPKRALASILGTTPETLSRVLTRLSRDNIIAYTDHRYITIMDRDTLEKLSRAEMTLS